MSLCLSRAKDGPDELDILNDRLNEQVVFVVLSVSQGALDQMSCVVPVKVSTERGQGKPEQGENMLTIHADLGCQTSAPPALRP